MRWRLTILFFLAALLAAPTAWAAEPVALKNMNFIENVAALPDQPCAFLVQAQNRAGYDSAKVYRQGDEVHVNLYTPTCTRRCVFSKTRQRLRQTGAVHQINKQFVKMIITLTPVTTEPRCRRSPPRRRIGTVRRRPTDAGRRARRTDRGGIARADSGRSAHRSGRTAQAETDAQQDEAKPRNRLRPRPQTRRRLPRGGIDWSDTIVKGSLR
jgi:hypothetical protein